MKSIVTILIPAALLLAGCTAEETPGNGPAIPPVEATVPLGIESASLSAEVTSRAVHTLTSGSIGIFLSGTGYTSINNRRYDYGSPAWAPNGGAANTIYLGGTTASVCAYYPWQSGITNSGAVTLTSGVLDNTDKDICFAKNRNMDGSSGNKSTAFAMGHAYAKITFDFTRDNYPGTCQVQKVELNHLLPSANLNIGSGAYSTSAGTLNSSISQSKNIPVAGSGTTLWGDDFLLVPCTPAGSGMTIVITVDGKSMSTNIPTATYKPVAGEYKTVKVTVKGTGINVTSVTTEDWVNGNIGPVVPLP